MNEESAYRAWSRRRWAGALVIAVGVQFGLLSWLSAKAPLKPLTADPKPQVIVPAQLSKEVLALSDPTLFALGGPRGFSKWAWMHEPQRPVENPDWTEPPRWLEMRTNQLASAFLDYADRNRAPVHGLAAKPTPVLTLPPTSQTDSRLPDSSSLTVQGDLAERRLMTAIELPSWPFGDVLANSVVQVIVDARGLVISAALLSGSGFADADRHALAQARRARFATVAGAREKPQEPTVGKLVFRWHSLPPLATNSPPSVR